MKKTILVVVAALSCAAWADKVYLKSGSFLSGSVAGVSSGEITFKSDDLGEVKIKVENIVKLEDAGSHVVKFVDESETTKKLAVKDGAYIADGKPLEMASVKAIDPVQETWHGNVNVAFNAARGNTYDNTAAVLANLNRRWEIDRVAFDFGYYYGESGKAGNDRQKTEDRWEVEGKHDHFWLPKVYHYENLKYERDDIQQLEARYRVGLGGGYQWLDGTTFAEQSGKWSFNQEFGLNWIKEEYKDNDDEKADGFAALRYAHHLNWIPVWAEGLECFHNAEVLPEVDEWEKFLAKCDVGFSTKIVFNFDLLAKIEWEYNSMPANDRKKNDTRYIVGLGYKW